MAIGLLGSALAGAVQGGAQADINNTAEANKQTEAMNLKSQEAAVNDMYAQAAERRHVGYVRDAMQYSSGLINAGAQQLLEAQGKHMPIAGAPTPGQADDGNVADLGDIKEAMVVSAAQHGLLDTKTLAETSSKEAITLAQAASHENTAKITGELNVLARAGQGADQAKINSQSRVDVADIAARAKATIAAVSQERDLYKVLSDLMADPRAKAQAQKALDKLHSGDSLPSGGNAPSSSAPSNLTDQLLPAR